MICFIYDFLQTRKKKMFQRITFTENIIKQYIMCPVGLWSSAKNAILENPRCALDLLFPFSSIADRSTFTYGENEQRKKRTLSPESKKRDIDGVFSRRNVITAARGGLDRRWVFMGAIWWGKKLKNWDVRLTDLSHFARWRGDVEGERNGKIQSQSSLWGNNIDLRKPIIK